jgi:hypothetical protein
MPQTDAGRTLHRLLAGERGVFVHRAFIRRFGLATAAFLDQAIYWTPITEDEDGWFYKRREEWAEETGLSRHEQETARATLRKAGLLKEERRGGIDRTVWFRVDLDAVAALLREPTDAGGVTDASAKNDRWKGQDQPMQRPDRTVVKGAQSTPQSTAQKAAPRQHDRAYFDAILAQHTAALEAAQDAEEAGSDATPAPK